MVISGTRTVNVLSPSESTDRINNDAFRPRSSKHDGDLYVRTSWTDAALALAQVEKGKADGGRTALWMRSRLQERLFSWGCLLQRHAGKVLFVTILLLVCSLWAFRSIKVHSRVHQLWVQEGGRLEKELSYTQKVLGEADSSTHQLVIQTPRDPDASLLHSAALLSHLEVVKAATSVTVHMYENTWKLKDMCYSPSIPYYESHFIEQIFENIMPCAIITPLDCFWEGSKLVGPETAVHIPMRTEGGNLTKVQWMSLNPLDLVKQFRKTSLKFPYSALESYMKQAGISTGYLEKPCLNPRDPQCPETAPNKNSMQDPDIGAELTGGCYGFAANYMHWPEDLIVGGAVRNKTRHVRHAKALQTVVQLMGEREMFEFFSGTYRVHHIGWSQEKAAAVLEAWQRKFSEEIKRYMNSDSVATSYNVYAFSTVTLNDILEKFSEVSLLKIAIGYVGILIYAGISLMRWRDPLRSQAGIAMGGVLLVSITVAAGLGVCAMLTAFNASTTQIVPFLAAGIGVNDMFLLTHTYAEQTCNEVPPSEQTGVVLKKTGLSVLLTSLCNIAAFFAASLIPIPALRAFSLQAAILLLFNLASMLIVFPAMVSLDLRRRRDGRCDILCCLRPPAEVPVQARKFNSVSRTLHPDRTRTVTSVINGQTSPHRSWIGSEQDLIDPENISLMGCAEPDCWSFSLTKFAAKYYAPYIMRRGVKVCTVLLMMCVTVACLYAATKITDGLDLTDIVPQNTDEHKFLSAQGKYFGFYNMHAVTKGDFEYPTNQRLLYEFHEAFVRIQSVIKNDNGGLPEFWLSLFRDWLIGLQKAFDKDYAQNCITQERWYENATDEAVFAYKLLVQTGHVDNPIDKNLITQVRLVDSDGIINPKAFYNYLTAWASNEALAYGASQANLRPEPREWYFIRDFELKIPKSAPLIYSQLPFYLSGLNDTPQIKELIGQVRELCERFEARGLPNYPAGIPFLFWEQYLGLRPALGLALVCALGAVFIVVSVLLLNLWAALLVVITLAAMVLMLLGAMYLLGIKLSAMPAVLLIVAVGLGVHFTVHLCLSFVTSIGNRERRARLALEHVFAPVFHGALTTLIGVMMLGSSEFEFIIRYFFNVLLCLVGIGLVTGLLFFPVLLSIVGPAAELIPFEYPDRISTPSPEPSPKRPRKPRHPEPPRRSSGSRGSKSGSRMHAPSPQPSLTTITEEPHSWHSTQSMQSIVVQPEVVVETTYNTNDSSSSGRSSPNAPQTITKVTATANIKVEVHAPVHTRRSHHRESRDSGHESDSSRH